MQPQCDMLFICPFVGLFFSVSRYQVSSCSGLGAGLLS